ncbi:MAG: hypothetical protein M0Z80_10430 [Treponema sp.]|nr:hypothetical protein [Treponema sp.]
MSFLLRRQEPLGGKIFLFATEAPPNTEKIKRNNYRQLKPLCSRSGKMIVVSLCDTPAKHGRVLPEPP